MSDPSSWYVYLLLCANDHLYCGVTNNINKRIKQHNGELKGGAKYTRANKPCMLVYKEVVSTKSDALKREAEIKKLNRKDKLVLISKESQ
jgi:putative endonuclease